MPFDSSHRFLFHYQINQSHCILVSLNAINSSIQVACEVTRAHARHKEIILIEDEKEEKKEIPKYLPFLSHKLKIKYKNKTHLIKSLSEYFKNKSPKFFNKSLPYEAFELIDRLSELYEQNEYNFRKDLTTNILNEAKEEISSLYNSEYRKNVGIEKNFLIRAKAIFENSTKIYAVSLDKVSTFWEKANNKKLAIEYIKSQPENTIRPDCLTHLFKS